VGVHVYFIARIPVRLPVICRAEYVRRMCSLLRCVFRPHCWKTDSIFNHKCSHDWLSLRCTRTVELSKR